jgi:hypothetical protein
MMFYRGKFVALSHPNSFLRESGKLYLLYMLAGVSAIPAGALYAILAVKGYDGWLSALLAIALGFLMAISTWKYVERKFFTLEYNPAASANSNGDIIMEMQAGAMTFVWDSSVGYRGSLAFAHLTTASRQAPVEDARPENQRAIEAYASAGN